MAYLVTAPDVSFGLVEGRAVFLDVRRDRYATLPADLLETLTAILAQESAVEPDDPAVHRLVATGLLAVSAAPRPMMRTVHCPPAAGLRDDAGQPLRPGDLVEVWWRLARAARSVATQSFRDALAPPRMARPATSRQSRRAQLASAARRFLHARRFVPMAPTCLADSLALRAWLARRGFGSRLVLAVRLEPFEAHCWVEAGGMVLNDAPERIATFVPVALFP